MIALQVKLVNYLICLYLMIALKACAPAGNGWGYFILVVFLNQMAADAMISAVTAFFHNRQVQDFGEPFCLAMFQASSWALSGCPLQPQASKHLQTLCAC